MYVPFIAYGYLYQYFPLLKKESVASNKSHENFNLSQTFRNYKQPKYTYKGTKKCADSINRKLKCKSEQLVNAT